MNGKLRKLFTVIREKKFDDNFFQIARGCARIPDVENNIDWALSRYAPFFPTVPGFENYHIWKSDFIDENFPQISILYEFDPDEEKVILINVVDN